MKKFLSLSLALLLTLSLGASLVSCNEHECEFKQEWTSDATHHWHECTGENCLLTDGKAEHDWDDGTANEAGVIVVKCKVCGAVFSGEVEEQEWEAAVAEQKFDNVTINYTFDTEGEGLQIHVVKITSDKVYRSMTPDPATEPIEKIFEGEEAAYQRNAFLSMFLSLLAEKQNFTYDSELKAYIMPQEVQTRIDIPTSENAYILETMKNGRVVFDANGNVISFNFWISEATYGGETLEHETRGNISLTFSDYGTTVVNEVVNSSSSSSPSKTPAASEN